MYHEAKKYEKKVKEILVDYRKRAERRQSFYQKIKTDPTQFLQIHGRKCKIHIDPSLGVQDVGIMMKWNNDVLIDRFDGRAHLDSIPQTTPKTGKDNDQELCMEERQLNYERFRILILNEFLCLKEQDFLTHLDEWYEINAQNDIKSKKKRQTNKSGVSIGYSYDTDDYSPQTFLQSIATVQKKPVNSRYDDLAKDSSESDMDLDLPIDINKVSTVDANELNATGRRYGLLSNDFFSFITNDIDELQALKESQKEEGSKTNRTGRRERRSRREQKMKPGSSAIPSYAKTDNENDKVKHDKQEDESSESNTDIPEKITYITSFGNEERKSVDNHRPLYSEKLKENLEKFKTIEKRYKSSRRYSSFSSSSSSSDYYRRKRLTRTSRNRSRSSSSSSNQSRKRTLSTVRASPKDNCSKHNQNDDIPIKRYYGRNRNSSDSSELSYDEQTNQNESTKSIKPYEPRGGKSSINVKGPLTSTAEAKVNPKERLKRKMQILLNKQYKEDKKLETLKKLQQIEEQKEREVEMKELALKLRKRQREVHPLHSSSEREETHYHRARENSKPKHEKRSRSSTSSSTSSRSSYSRSKSRSTKYHRSGTPDSYNKYYSNKYERYDKRRHSSRERRSPDKYTRKKSRYRSKSPERYCSRNRKY